MKRPFIKDTAYALADIVASEFAKHHTDKKLIREVQNELEFRNNVVARTLKQMIITWFKSLPK